MRGATVCTYLILSLLASQRWYITRRSYFSALKLLLLLFFTFRCRISRLGSASTVLPSRVSGDDGNGCSAERYKLRHTSRDSYFQLMRTSMGNSLTPIRSTVVNIDFPKGQFFELAAIGHVVQKGSSRERLCLPIIAMERYTHAQPRNNFHQHKFRLVHKSLRLNNTIPCQCDVKPNKSFHFGPVPFWFPFRGWESIFFHPLRSSVDWMAFLDFQQHS